jgi:uncharacterized damage-inducible protein DinB
MELFEYNYWARDRQFKSCSDITDEQFVRHVDSSFSCLRDTLAHLIEAEWEWLQRWRGGSPSAADRSLFEGRRYATPQAIRDRWTPVEMGVRGFVADLTEGALVQPLT